MAGKFQGFVAPGTTIGRWTVLKEAAHRFGARYLRCQCACGVIRDIAIGKLRSGGSRSCGCRKTTHGMTISAEYRAWKAMIYRCYDTNNPSYRHYGGRGIRVCAAWRNSFSAFFKHIGPKPHPKLSLDRIDNDGDYRPGNVRWATMSEQMLNARHDNTRVSNNAKRIAIKRHGRQVGAIYGTIKPGSRIGHWTVIREVAPRYACEMRFLRCRCRCGTVRDVAIVSLRKGVSRSCGCRNKKRVHTGFHHTR